MKYLCVLFLVSWGKAYWARLSQQSSGTGYSLGVSHDGSFGTKCYAWKGIEAWDIQDKLLTFYTVSGPLSVEGNNLLSDSQSN